MRFGGILLVLRKDIAHQHARMRQDRATQHALQQVDHKRVVLQRVVVLQSIDPPQRPEIGRIRIDAEARQVGNGILHRPVAA